MIIIQMQVVNRKVFCLFFIDFFQNHDKLKLSEKQEEKYV